MHRFMQRPLAVAAVIVLTSAAVMPGCSSSMSQPRSQASPLRGSMLSRADVVEATRILLAEKGDTSNIELPDDAKMRTAISAATHVSLRPDHDRTASAASQPVREDWMIYGHDWFVVYDDIAKDWVHFWQNTNPGQPPDESGWQCFGYVWHWCYNRELNRWTVDNGCGVDTPGYKSYAFYGR